MTNRVGLIRHLHKQTVHDDVIKWKHFPRHWPSFGEFTGDRVTGHLGGEFTGEFPAERPVTRSFDVFIDLRLNNDWVNNREAGDLRRYRTHFDVIVMCILLLILIYQQTHLSRN